MSDDEYGRLIQVDFKKKEVEFVYDYLKMSGDINKLKAIFRDALNLIDAIAHDKPYTRSRLFEFLDIVRTLEKRVERHNHGRDKHE